MATSETRALDLFRRWMRRITSIVEAPFSQTRDAKIFVGSIEFSGGQRLTLADNSILVIVGQKAQL